MEYLEYLGEHLTSLRCIAARCFHRRRRDLPSRENDKDDAKIDMVQPVLTPFSSNVT